MMLLNEHYNRKEWPLLDRFCTGGGRFNYWQCKWGLTPDQLCDFRADIQTMEHMINEQFSLHFQERLACLHRVTEAGLLLVF